MPHGNPRIPPPSGWKVFLFFLSLRILNASTTRTFFQPDEYFQSLEPALKIALPHGSGAWITWEWRESLRSSLHPYIFAGWYQILALVALVLRLDSHNAAELHVVGPKILQALFAALTDLYTWRLVIKHQGARHDSTNATSTSTIFMLALSPWQWFCSTRTLMNSLECTLTVAALYCWPWEMFSGIGSTVKIPYRGRLLIALLLAAVATILRVPNVILWMVIGGCCVAYRLWLWQRAISAVSQVLCIALLTGTCVLTASVAADFQFYGRAVFPPYRFLQFNVVESLAVFYGHNRRDYYFTEGLPILLTTYLPFALYGIYDSLCSAARFLRHKNTTLATRTAALREITLVLVIITTVLILSSIPHKEVRFLYPLLPILHIFAIPSFTAFFAPFPFPRQAYRKVLLVLVSGFNISLALYASQVHQRGVIDVLHYLRHSHEQLHPHVHLPALSVTHIPFFAQSGEGQRQEDVTTAGFLMPCHSTPWRSHLVYPGIKAWALTCEPPLNKTMEERRVYLDEADDFYARPTWWLGEKMADPPVAGAGTGETDVDRARQRVRALAEAWKRDTGEAGGAWEDGRTGRGRREWPMFLVFFEQLQPVMETYMAGKGGYRECWRGFNSHFHDDWRRKGDVIVWCRREVDVLLREGR
ncbi:hypothetical protein CAC42_6527 [Sphaceloma murrayae]|uniref:Mannosyltransferase n=1 Tax=Sphaceloma murrayae TaxID=2082308 RepID=A0A2K1QFR8_9PEZI|nr:hypothetical protein CAC42_6527 [Sphaceloma murrayae]